jgi:hypothetical protein
MTPGQYLMGIGALHEVIGLAEAPIRQGLFNAIRNGGASVEHLDEMASLWFHCSGVLMILHGHLLHLYEHRTRKRVPNSVGYGLIGVSGVGAALLPASGFWLVLALGVHIVVRV